MFKKNERSTRRSFVQAISAAAAATTFLSSNTLSTYAASSSKTQLDSNHPSGTGINVLLVHGAFVDASSWNKVIPLLQDYGLNVLAVQNPLTSLQDDINATSQALASLSGPTILVGHSYGGSVITNINTQNSNVAGLVYIAAYAPEVGESVGALNAQFPASPAAAHFGPAYQNGFVWIDPSFFPDTFVQDISRREARALAVTQKPTSLACFEPVSGDPAWKHIPSWYLVSSNDRTIQPDAERFMAQRIGATTREIASSHASPVSHPYEVASIILLAARHAR
ncbi:alpha/beta hydrolase [Tengunoibacter tsumagoiensis]|uniref:Alpha/beta hydrolase n=1 Tax=Tengunoibacter tsumagoiensis TaxID=2014871 RepID=A0A402A390_9CHLR|nr:alpha/beta hydrolase [Tengunoibacter tsumagoiensis]GCE13509.1 alpha/beta hydrolase [Tengunoibacter tsumagoiensis]